MNEESLFAAALERATAAERRAFLRGACAGDAALRRRLERLLAAHDRASGILDPPATMPGSVAATSHSDADGVSAAEPVGTLIAGRYRLIEEIGAGGMGTVWKAEQTQPVRRIVALKLIKAGMDSRSVLSRFEAERQALALMDHPNIAKVLDGGTTENGRPFFVMEYVKGVPFTQYCDDARLSIAERLALFVPVCQAVQHAHTKGIIHRDLKPSNILIGLHDGRPAPKVIDFGLAKALHEPLTDRTLQTAHGTMLGTPLYISPEQAELNPSDVDTRTDIYALGVLLYELLTGTTPLEKQRFQEVAWHELLRLIKEESPPRPSARLGGSDALPSLAAQRQSEPQRLTRLVRGELDWIVMKCLEKDRSRRYETANGLARDVERYLSDDSVEACPPSAGYRLAKFLRRNRGPVLSVGVLLLLLVAGVIGTSVGLMRAEEARKGERLAKETAEKRLTQIEGGVDILSSIFEDLDPLAEEKEGRSLRTILGERLDRAAAALEGEAVGDPLVVAKLQDRLGRTYRALGNAAKAKALFAKALAIRRAELGDDDADTLAVMSHQASALYDVGDLKEAIGLYEQVRQSQMRILGTDHRDTLATANDLAMAYRMAGDAREACILLEQARDALLKKYGGDDPQTIDALYNLSAVYELVGRGAEAITLAQQVRDARVRVYGIDHTLAIDALNNLASRYQGAGKMGKARDLFEEARDGIVPRLGAEHPISLDILDNLARIYRAYGRATEAVSLAEKVRDSRVLTLGVHHPDTIYTMHNLGSAYRDKGEPEKALAMYQQAATGLEKRDFVHVGAGQIIWDLCDYLERSQQFEQAGMWRRKWLAALKKRDGPDSSTYAAALAKLGGDLILCGRHAIAEPILRESVAILQQKPDDLTKSHAQSSLGDVLLEQKKYVEAEPLLVRGYEGLKAREAQIPPLYARFRISQAGERVVRLYEAWRRPEKAAEWREKVAEDGEFRH
jgi:serine/threonine protein kinase/tetratricopeptide (TPR) repeat protein